MVNNSITFIGLDTHKEFFEVAYIEDNREAKHLRWLTELILPHPSQQIVLQEAIQTITGRIRRLERLYNELSYHVKNWRYYPFVKAIQVMRGVRLLVEGAHTYHYAATISTELKKRQESLSKEIIDIAWQAQLRLCRRYQRLMKRGKHYNL